MRVKGVHFLSLFALALAAGCNFAPPYHPPAQETPALFKETNNWKTAEPGDGVIKGNWWEVFQDRELDELESKVAISNQNVLAGLENFLAARAIARQSRAALFPTVTLDPSATKIGGAKGGATSTGSGTNNSATSSTAAFAIPVDGTWQPDLWGAIRNTVRANTYAAQASAAQLENLRLSAQAELASDYFALRSQDGLIQLYADTVKGYRDSLDLTKILAETGIESELDVAQADTLLETTLAQATALGIQRAQLEHAIALLVGQPASVFSLKPAPFKPNPPAAPVGLPSQLLERRPDIAAAERGVAQANAGIGVARAAYFPTLNLTAGAGYQSSSISSLLNASSFAWGIGANLSETLFDAGRRRAVSEQAWATYRAAAANYRQAVLTAFQQVEDNLSSLRILSAEASQQEVAVRASQRNLDLALERYRLGINSYLNVITAQQTLLGNQQTAVNIHLQQMSASVQLIMALGGGWNPGEIPSSKRVLNGSSSAAGAAVASH